MTPQVIRSLQNAHALLDVLAQEAPMSIADVARQMRIPRSSTYRLVDALMHAGLVRAADHCGDLRIGLHPRILRLAADATHQNPLIQAASHALTDLRDQTGLTAYLCTVHGSEVACLDCRPGHLVSVLQLRPGGTLPPHAGAAARVCLAYDDELLLFARAVSTPKRLTAHTLIEVAELDADVVQTRRRGYTVSDEDVTLGIAAIGVPLRAADGHLIGALSLAGMRDVVVEQRARLAETLRRSATAVIASLAK